jgi:chitinase
MGEYAVKAAEATQKQIKPLLGIRDDARTPMIGVNDVEVEVFRVQDAVELREFAREKQLGGLSMWSATRDKPCPRGSGTTARATCSSTGTSADAFMKAFTG